MGRTLKTARIALVAALIALLGLGSLVQAQEMISHTWFNTGTDGCKGAGNSAWWGFGENSAYNAQQDDDGNGQMNNNGAYKWRDNWGTASWATNYYANGGYWAGTPARQAAYSQGANTMFSGDSPNRVISTLLPQYLYGSGLYDVTTFAPGDQVFNSYWSLVAQGITTFNRTWVGNWYITGDSWNFAGGLYVDLLTMRSSGSVLLQGGLYTFKEGAHFYNGTIVVNGTNIIDRYVWQDTETAWKNVIQVRGNVNFNRTQSSFDTYVDPFRIDVNNRFHLQEDFKLTLGIPSGYTMRVTGIDSSYAREDTATKGGAFYLMANTDLLRYNNASAGQNTNAAGRLELYRNQAYRGGGVYSEQNLTVQGNTYFGENAAVLEGGAIYMAGSQSSNRLTLDTGPVGGNKGAGYGDIVFEGNKVFVGDYAPYVVGGEYRGYFKTDGAGNFVDANGNVVADPTFNGVAPDYDVQSIFLAKNTELRITGENRVYINDTIATGVGDQYGGNSLIVELVGTNFVQFGLEDPNDPTANRNNSVLNPTGTRGGGVDIRSGQFRIVKGATFTNQGGNVETNSFNVQVGAILAGGGMIASQNGFSIMGNISADNMTYRVPTNLDGTDYPVYTGSKIGYLELHGNTNFIGTQILVDVDQAATRLNTIAEFAAADASILNSDIIMVDAYSMLPNEQGIIKLAGGDDKSTIIIDTWDNFNDGRYVIASAQHGIVDADSGTTVTTDTIMNYFTEVQTTSAQLDGRRAASIFIEENQLGRGEKDIILQTTNGGNVYLLWRGQTDSGNANNLWDDTTVTWKRKDSVPDNLLNFQDGDFVIFNTQDNVGNVYTVQATSPWEVSGMIVEDGVYHFMGSTISGKSAPAAGVYYVGVNATARLDVTGADTTAILNLDTDFEHGTTLADGATIVTGNDLSLGAYVNTATNERGTLTLNNTDGTLVTSYYGDDRELSVHFEILQNSTLTLTIPDGLDPPPGNETSLVLRDVDTSNSNFTAASKKQNHRGGVFYFDQGASMVRDTSQRLSLIDNKAQFGGGIYAESNLVLQGNLLFQGNQAVQQGGAVYMGGSGGAARLTLDTDYGDIVFTGDNVQDADGVATANSVFLKGFTTIEITDENNVFFDAPIDTDRTATASGNNYFTMNGTGIVQLQGVNYLNPLRDVVNPTGKPGGEVNINSGTFRLAGPGAEFNTAGTVNMASFNLARGAVLAGSGTITVQRTSGNAFVLRGTISPDSDVLTSELHGGAAHLVVGENDEADLIGQLSLNGNVLMDSVILEIDLGTAGQYDTNIGISDKVFVDGNITLGTTNGLSTINLYSLTGVNDTGDYLLVSTTGAQGFVGVTGSDTTAYFNALTNTLRASGDFEFKDSDSDGVYDQLWLVNYSGSSNVALYWTGSQSTAWDVRNTENWITGRGGDAMDFYQGDYVIFDDSQATGVDVRNYSVDLTNGGADFQVAGMDVVSGWYEITATNGEKMIGTANAGFADSGKLKVIGGGNAAGVYLYVATEFEGGTEVGGTIAATGAPNAQIGIGHAQALGTYTHGAANRQGYVHVIGDALIGVEDAATAADAHHFVVQNRFEVENGLTLAFYTGLNETLTVRGVDVTIDNSDGGAVVFNGNGTLLNTGFGVLIFDDNTAENGGAVSAAGNLTLNGLMTFTGNEAMVSGGAIHADGNIEILAGATLVFTGNTAARDGGAIHTDGTVTIGGAATFGGTAAGTGNHAEQGGAVYAQNLNITGAGTTFAGNSADNDGGAVYATGQVDLAAGTSFNSNVSTGGFGGAIYAAQSATPDARTVTIGNQSVFTGNLAGTSGGAVYTERDLTVGDDTNFANNAAVFLGGAIYGRGDAAVTIGNDVTFTINAAGDDGGAIYSENDLTIGTGGVFTGNQSLAGSGGAVYARQNVTVGGGTLFLNNTAAGDGGAIYMFNTTVNDPRFDLNLDATGGHIVFEGNTSAGGASDAIFLDKNIDVTLTGDSDIYFGDTIDSGGAGNTFVVNMDATAKTIMNADALIDGTTTITSGNLTVTGGTTFTSTGALALATNGTLSGGGTVEGNGITLRGIVSPNSFTYAYDAAGNLINETVVDKEVGVLTLVGDTGINGATLKIDLDAANVSDRIDIVGAVTADGTNKIMIGTFQEGTFDILTSDTTVLDAAFLSKFELDPKNYGSRNTAEIVIKSAATANGQPGENGKTLQLVATGDGSVFLYWTGSVNGSNDLTWYANLDTAKTNWIVDEDTTRPEYFMSGDRVFFTGENYVGNRYTVTIDGAALVAGMDVTGGTYVFNGTGVAIQAKDGISKLSAADTTLSLAIANAGTSATFNFAVDFAKDLTINAGATGIFNGDATFGGNVTVDNASTATFTKTLETTNLTVDAGSTANLAATTLTGDLAVDASSVRATGLTDVAGNVRMTNGSTATLAATEIGNVLIVDGSSLTTGTLDVTNGAAIQNNSTANLGATTVGGDLLIADGSTATVASAVVDGYMDVTNSNTTVTATLEVGQDLTVDTATTFSVGGLTTVDGDMSLSNVTTATFAEMQIAGNTAVGNVNTANFNGNAIFGDGLDITASNVTLNGANTNDIGTTVAGTSTLTLGNDGAFGSADVTVMSNSRTTMTSNEDRTIANDVVNNGQLTIDMADGRTFTYAGDMSGTGNVIKNGGGTLAVTGNGSDIDGTLTVNTGTLHVLDNARFEAGTITVVSGSTLMGNGTLAADRFNVSGVLSAGNVAGEIGTLTFDGDMTLGVTEISVDLNAGQIPTADLIVVTGRVSFSQAASNENMIALNIVGDWEAGNYQIIDTGNGFNAATEADILKHFDVTYGGQALNSRQEATLTVLDDKRELWLTLNDINSLKLYWNGTYSSAWDTETENWYDESGTEIGFMSGDYVVFQETAKEKAATITNEYKVSGMDIDGGSYTFIGNKITGDAAFATNQTLGTGRLNITTDGTVTFLNETAFDQGVYVGTAGKNTTIVLGNDKALGSTIGANNEGNVYVNAHAEATIKTVAGQNRSIENRFITETGSQLNLTAVKGTTLTVTNVNKAPTYGGAIRAYGDVDISGAVSFLDNVSSSFGGAISMASNTTLTLDTEDGPIVFQGNLAGTNSNSVHLDSNATLVIDGQNDTWFYDPISGTAGATFTKNGSGTVHLFGNSSLGLAGSAGINTGTLRLEEGASFDVGTGKYAMKTGTTLSGQGTIRATDGMTISGTVSADAYDRNGNGSDIGTINLVGDTVFSRATLEVDLASGNVSDTINVTGAVSFTDTNVVSITSWLLGTYDLVYADSNAMGDPTGKWTILYNGEELVVGDRLHADIVKTSTAGNDVLQLIADGLNANLVWKGTYTQIWDTSTRNWNNKDNNDASDKFYAGDAVEFRGEGQGAITVNNTVSTAGMTVTAGEYTFNGPGMIRGSKDGTTLDNATGDLRITGGSTTFNTATHFEGAINLIGTDTSVTLGKDGSFVTEDAFLLGADATLYLTPQTGSIVGDSVTINGTVIVDRPDSSQIVTKVVQSTGTELDMDRMHAVFDETYGLVSQFVTNDDAFSINLNYDLMTPGEFADLHDLGWNMGQIGDGLTEIFEKGDMEELYDYLYSLRSNDDVTSVLNQLRGTEQAADALTMAMWRPWEKVFKQLDDEYCRNEEAPEGKRFKRLYNRRHFWFEGYYRYTDVRSDRNARKYHENRGGMMLGMDLLTERNGDSAVGITFGYGKPRLTSKFGQIEADDYTLALYAKTKLSGGGLLQGFLGYGTQRFDSERYALGERYNARYSGDALYMSLEWFRPSVMSPRVTLAPVVAFDLQSTWTNRFGEQGGYYRQNVDSSSLTKAFARVGARATFRQTDRINLLARMQYAFMFAGKARGSVDTVFAASPSTSMHLRGVKIGRNWLNLGVGGEVYIGPSKRMRFFGDYDFDYIGRAAAHTGQIGFGIGW